MNNFREPDARGSVAAPSYTLTRRDFLHAGALPLVGLTLPGFFALIDEQYRLFGIVHGSQPYRSSRLVKGTTDCLF